jgi:replicative DNA helicase
VVSGHGPNGNQGAPSPARPVTGYQRTPPQNLEAEVAVLGAALLSRSALAEVIEQVRPDDFYRSSHRTIYEAILELFRRGEVLDPITIVDQLQKTGRLDDVGGANAIHDLVASVPTAANAMYYARIVSEKALLRRLIEAGTEVVGLGYDAGEDVNLTVDRAEQLIYDISSGRVGSEYSALKELLSEGFERIEQRFENRSEVTGLATGLDDFDRLTAGLQKQNLVIVAARPAMGKSSLSLGITQYVTVNLQRPAIIFSLEMSKAEIVDRVLSSEARVDSFKIRNGRLDDADWASLSDAMGRLADAPLFIDDTAAITMMEIRAKCRRLKARYGLELVVVDYLQLMQSHRRTESRQQEVSEISRGLKMLAKELDVPVIALSQLSRQPESRNDKRPQLSDLRESGCLTADTQIVRADSGAHVTMGELYARGETDIPVWTLGDDLRLRRGRMTHVFSSGVKEVFELQLRSGRTVTASANHPFLAPLRGWLRLDQLTVGSLIAIPEVWPMVEPGPSRSAAASQGVLRAGAARLPGGGSLLAVGGALRNRAAEPPASAVAVLDPPLVGSTTDVYWDEIVGIEPCGREEVFDATVPGTHNFIADGVVVHNSIEQDADVVSFIYRDEVYDPDSMDKGTAELIVAKHRNGPTGVVKLAFLDHYTKFANLARTTI